MDKIVLIGGSPTAGKSYTAKKLAESLKLPWILTDTIRDQMRKIVRKQDYPRLFQHSEATSKMAVEFLTHNTAEEIVNHQNRESEEVWKGVKALIETDYVWKSFIVERVRKTIFTRGLWDEPSKYPDSVKEKEVEWVVAFNNYIKEEAKKYKLPVVSVGDRKRYLGKIKKIIS